MDCRKKESLKEIFEENNIEVVINFAGFKAVGESVREPLMYYDNNLIGAITLLEVMKEYNCKKFIFSSSATIYGNPEVPEYVEEMGRGKTTNPYGTTKAMIEQILEDLYASDNTWDICILRYFNPIGAHESGLLGENPNGIPNNLMPYIMKVASGKLEKLNVFGNDYDTKDGTGMRDYIHVVDVADGHIKALDKLDEENSGLFIYNLGTGTAYSVLDIVNTFEKVNNIKIPYQIVPRRPGDIAINYANPKKANEELGWFAQKGIEDMCRDSWNFEKNNI
jgi:UDP-glucose 4-epimerase